MVCDILPLQRTRLFASKSPILASVPHGFAASRHRPRCSLQAEWQLGLRLSSAKDPNPSHAARPNHPPATRPNPNRLIPMRRWAAPNSFPVFSPHCGLLCAAGLIGSANHARRGLSGETLLRRHRAPARLWVAVAALVTGTIWLWSSSSVVLFGTYRVQVCSPPPRLFL